MCDLYMFYVILRGTGVDSNRRETFMRTFRKKTYIFPQRKKYDFYNEIRHLNAVYIFCCGNLRKLFLHKNLIKSNI